MKILDEVNAELEQPLEGVRDRVECDAIEAQRADDAAAEQEARAWLGALRELREARQAVRDMTWPNSNIHHRITKLLNAATRVLKLAGEPVEDVP